jgi:hypothetical protein
MKMMVTAINSAVLGTAANPTRVFPQNNRRIAIVATSVTSGTTLYVGYSVLAEIRPNVTPFKMRLSEFGSILQSEILYVSSGTLIITEFYATGVVDLADFFQR